MPESPGPVPSAEDAPSGDRAHGARTTMDALAGSRDVFETFFDRAYIGLALADLRGCFVRVNATYAALLGRSPEDLVGVPLADVLWEVAGEGLVDLGRLVSGQEQALQVEASHVHADGQVTWLLHGVATVAAPDGTPGWYAVSAQDITGHHNAEQELRALTDVLAARAAHDPLTGLANRALLEDRLRAALSRDARTGESTSVLFLDLDGFKEINDRYGHAAGDAVLCGVAERLTAVVRPSDTVARVGGDEFVVLVESATPAALEVLLPRVQAAVSRPLAVPGRTSEVGSMLEVGVSVSVGVAMATAGSGDPRSLLAMADERMYDAKRAR